MFFFFKADFSIKDVTAVNFVPKNVPIILVLACVYFQQHFFRKWTTNFRMAPFPPSSSNPSMFRFASDHPTFLDLQVRSFQQHAEPGNLRKSVLKTW